MSFNHEIFNDKAARVYSFLDKDKDGFLSREDLSKGFEQLKLPIASQDELLEEMNANRKGVSKEEFRFYAEKQYFKLKRLFDKLDINKDNVISPDELIQSVRNFDPHSQYQVNSILRIFQKIDKNHDGKIDFEEWCNFLILLPEVNVKEVLRYWGTIITIADPSDFTLYGLNQAKTAFSIRHSELMNWLTSFGAGFIAGLVSRTTMAPLDRLKLIYQTHYRAGKHPPSIFSGLKEIYKADGFKGLFRGNLVTIVRAGPETSIKLTVNEEVKSYLSQRRDNGKPTKIDSFIAGSTAGVVANVTTFPLGVLRTRLAASPSGTYHGIFDAIKKMQKTEGKIRPFFRGLQPALLAIVPNSGLQFTAYETLTRIFVGKRVKKEPNPLVFMLIGGLSALFSNSLLYPLQTVTSRLVMQGVLGDKKKNMHKTIKNILKHEGFRGFYKGYRAAITKIVLGNSISFGCFEFLKRVFGIDFRKKRH